MKPSPHQFRSLMGYRLAEAEQARKQALWQNFWRSLRFVGAGILVAAYLICSIHFPAQIIIGTILAILGCIGKYFWDCRYEATNYNDEFDL